MKSNRLERHTRNQVRQYWATNVDWMITAVVVSSFKAFVVVGMLWWLFNG